MELAMGISFQAWHSTKVGNLEPITECVAKNV